LLSPDTALAVVAILAACAAMWYARRVSARLNRLNESYWELRYDYGQLRARIARLEPPDTQSEPASMAPQQAAASFIPLSSIKR
jgi:hypothetical protein